MNKIIYRDRRDRSLTTIDHWTLPRDLIDQLSLSYQGNQRTTITDSKTNLTYSGSSEFVKRSTGRYSYNMNGALSKDENRGIIRTHRMNRIAFIIFVFCIIFEFANCSKTPQEKTPVSYSQASNNLPAIYDIIEEYHFYYGKHWGDQHQNDSLLINVCFYQRNDGIYVALSGCPFSLKFFYSKTGGIRSDMLGFCELGKDGIGVYDSVKEDKKHFVEHFLRGLTFKSAQDIFLEEERIRSLVSIDYYDFICNFRIDENYNYCLTDSGYYYQLEYREYEYDF